MTFRPDNQPNHDRAKTARTANSPWRKSTTLFRDERKAAKRKRGKQ